MAMGPPMFIENSWYMAQTIQSLQEQVRKLVDNHYQLAIRVSVLEDRLNKLEKEE